MSSITSRTSCLLLCPFSRHFPCDEAQEQLGMLEHLRVRPAGGLRRLSTQKGSQRWHQTVFSGIQPTGIPHLGNYLGALRPWVELQDAADASRQPHRAQFISVVDLHALTADPRPQTLSQWRKESFASLLAVGLDPKKSRIFMQSEVRYHSELMWILSTLASTGYLSRMTQWKSKLGLSDDTTLHDDAATAKLKLGLFSYPVLQAADILLYRATEVPVGEDQAQHIEFARTLAKSFNHRHGDIFPVPEAIVSPAKRVMSLTDPLLKMSKSHADPKSRILIIDTPDDIRAKIKVALTDSQNGISYSRVARPGVSNLLDILKHCSQNPASCSELAADSANLSLRAFKELVADSIITRLDGIRDRFHELMQPNNPDYMSARQEGLEKALSRANKTMQKVWEAVGLRDYDKGPAEDQGIEETSAAKDQKD